MPEVLLAVLVLAVLGYHAWTEHAWQAEREHLLHLLVAKSPSEVQVLDREIAPYVPGDPYRFLPDGFSEQVGL